MKPAQVRERLAARVTDLAARGVVTLAEARRLVDRIDDAWARAVAQQTPEGAP